MHQILYDIICIIPVVPYATVTISVAACLNTPHNVCVLSSGVLVLYFKPCTVHDLLRELAAY